MYHLARTDDEINDVLNWVVEGKEMGSHYTGMTFEDGIEQALLWVLGETDERPDA